MLTNGDVTEWDDEALLASIRQGSEDAFAQLANQYSPMIQRLAFRYRNHLVDTEDLIQEGMLGLLSAAHHFQSGAVAFRAYAFVCVRRRMLSAISRATRQQAQSVADEDISDMEHHAPDREQEADPVHLLLRREEEEQLFGQLQQWLSEREYQVLSLYLDAYSYDEMAKQLGISAKSVDNALQRIRKKLSAKGLRPLS